MSERTLVLAATRTLIARAGLRYRSEGRIPRDLLLALHAVLGEVFRSALDIVDRRGVVRLQEAGGRREVHLVKGSRGIKYNVNKVAHYCSCPAFQFQVLRGSGLTCKHLLALALAESCGTIKCLSVPTQEIKVYMKQL